MLLRFYFIFFRSFFFLYFLSLSIHTKCVKLALAVDLYVLTHIHIHTTLWWLCPHSLAKIALRFSRNSLIVQTSVWIYAHIGEMWNSILSALNVIMLILMEYKFTTIFHKCLTYEACNILGWNLCLFSYSPSIAGISREVLRMIYYLSGICQMRKWIFLKK